jgi:hypothetical protein
MVARSRTQREKWSRWIGSGALALALVGLLAPATTSARVYQDQTPEVIEVEGEAPEAPWGGHTGGHPTGVTPSGTPSGDSGGGATGGGGDSGGGSGASGITMSERARMKRIADAKQDCGVMEGVWGPAVFNDIVTNLRYSGYSCRYKFRNGTYQWNYYDSEGYLNQRCVGDLDVKTCEEP